MCTTKLVWILTSLTTGFKLTFRIDSGNKLHGKNCFPQTTVKSDVVLTGSHLAQTGLKVTLMHPPP